MAITTRSVNAALLLFTLLAVATTPARASLFTLAASGTISFNTSGDPTIPVGTPWTFEVTYDTAAPDLDPGHVGEHPVEHHEVGLAGGDGGERVAAVPRLIHLVALVAERRRDRVDNRRLVVDDEDACLELSGHRLERSHAML